MALSIIIGLEGMHLGNFWGVAEGVWGGQGESVGLKIVTFWESHLGSDCMS